MRKAFFYLVTIILILTLGSIGLAQGLPSLTESSSSPPSPLPPITDTTSPLPPVSLPVSPPETPSQEVSTFSYADPMCSFNFNYPSNWVPNEQVGGAEKKLKAEVDLFSGNYLIASFCVYADNTDLSLSQYALMEEEWMIDPQNMPEYNKIAEEAINLGTLPAIKRVYTYTYVGKEDDKYPLKAIDIYLVKDNRAYMLVGEVDQGLFDSILPDLESMFNSFALLETTTNVVSPPSVPSSTSISDEPAFKFCPYCGTPLQTGYLFCPECGKPIPVKRGIIKNTKEEGMRTDKKERLNYSANLAQTRGLNKEINQNQSDYSRGMNKNFSKLFNFYKPAFLSQSLSPSLGSQLVHIFPEEPVLPWAVSRKIISDYYDYGQIFPESLGRKISSQMLTSTSTGTGRSFYSESENLGFPPLKGLGKQIAFNPNLGTTFRRGKEAKETKEGGLNQNQLGSPLKNLGGGISSSSLLMVSRAPLSEKSWVLKDIEKYNERGIEKRGGEKGIKRGIEEDISMGSSIKKIASKTEISVVEPIRSLAFGGKGFSTLGQGISYELGSQREVEGLPSLTPPAAQTIPPPPTEQPEGAVSPAPGAPAEGGITLPPPEQTVPAQPSPAPGGITLPTPGGPQEPQIIWKQYSLNQAFGHNPMITGYLEYPTTWLINLDSFNRSVTFSEDASGLTSLTLFPGLMGPFSSAQDLAQQMAYLLQQRVPDLTVLNQEFKIVPTPGSGAIEVTEGKINLQGSYQGTIFRFNLETYLMYMGAYGSAPGMSGMGYVILTQAPQNIFSEKEQKYFNHIILSYKRSIGVTQ